jgi:WhiB family redox-sensing transcriptional regulator
VFEGGMVTRVRIHRRRIPPLDAWRGPAEGRQRIRDVKAWSWTWQRDAACRNLGSWLFFAPDGERASAKRQREAAAKAICGRCPVQAPCALYALATRQRYGVWGGLAEDDRRQHVADERRRIRAPRGRPLGGQR